MSDNKKLTGETVNGFINDLRIEKSKNLLIKTDQPISEISASVGYDDYDYFIRLLSGFLTPLSFTEKKFNWFPLGDSPTVAQALSLLSLFPKIS